MKKLASSPLIYRELCSFLFKKMNKDKDKLRKFMGYPINFQVPFIIEFLETKGVPFLTAVCYYQYRVDGTPLFQDLVVFTIICEFNRIENNKSISYIPF